MVKFLHLCFHAVIFIFYFSNLWSLKIENENCKRITLTAEAQYRTKAQFMNIETCTGWLELLLTGTNFRGPKPV